jgi:8-oxo-dGTP pyrophosphatase MutT (NUDIX family)
VKESSAGANPSLNMALIRERLAKQWRRDAADHLRRADDGFVESRTSTADARPAGQHAAVAAILRESHATRGPEVLLIRRAEHPLDPWSGHMAFPGGRASPGDRDLLATAVRETREELALDLSATATLIGRLDALPAIARGRRVGLTIAPFVFELTADAALVPNGEVAEVLWAPIAPLLDGSADSSVPYEFEGQRLTMPAYDVQGRVVWGLTYRMLQTLFTLLR